MIYTDADYRKKAIELHDAKFAAGAAVGRVEDLPDRGNAGAFVRDEQGIGHYVPETEMPDLF